MSKSLRTQTAALIGDVHGDLRALCTVLREVRAFKFGSEADSRRDGRKWVALETACSNAECPMGLTRPAFPQTELLRSLRYAGNGAAGLALVFCGDVIDSRRVGVTEGDDGFGVCGYQDSVELVVETISRLCAQSAGAVTWIIGNHDVWPLLASCDTCRDYAPLHQCDGRGYSGAFRRTLVESLLSADACAVTVVNDVLCCHGGLCAEFVCQALKKAKPPKRGRCVAALVDAINTGFRGLLQAAADSRESQVSRDEEAGRFAWLLTNDSPLMCRPVRDPKGFAALFVAATYPPQWAGLADELAQLSFCVAHTMQSRGVSVAEFGQPGRARAPAPRVVPTDAPRLLEGRDLLFVDTGMSRGFGQHGRVIQVSRVTPDRWLEVTQNLVSD